MGEGEVEGVERAGFGLVAFGAAGFVYVFGGVFFAIGERRGLVVVFLAMAKCWRGRRGASRQKCGAEGCQSLLLGVLKGFGHVFDSESGRANDQFKAGGEEDRH